MNAHIIIHSTTTAAAAVGAGMAQIPGSDAPVLASLQAAMILSLADHYEVNLTQAAAAELVLTFGAVYGGRSLSQVMVGWWPGVGNAINASTAAAITEAVGWAAVEWFEDEN